MFSPAADIHKEGKLKKERKFCISFDGQSISTKLLSKKKNLLETEMVRC